MSPVRAKAYALTGLTNVISIIEGRCPSLMLTALLGLNLTTFGVRLCPHFSGYFNGFGTVCTSGRSRQKALKQLRKSVSCDAGHNP